MNKHILYTVDYFAPHHGGVETSVLMQIQIALRAGYRVSVLTSCYDRTLPRHEKIFTADGSYVILRVGSGRRGYACHAARFFTHQSLDIHLVHGHSYIGALVGFRIANSIHVPVVTTIHEVFGSLRSLIKPRYIARVYRLLEYYIVTRKYDHIHVPSEYTFQGLVDKYALSPSMITHIYHYIDEDRSLNRIDGTYVDDREQRLGTHTYKILYYGHAGATKGLKYLIDALKQWLPDHADAHWIANITDSRARDYAVQKINQVLPREQVSLMTGINIHQLRALIVACDVVVVPSISEGFGYVGAEVSALGSPMVVARAGALPEVVHGPIYRVEPQSNQSIIQALDIVYHGGLVVNAASRMPNETSIVTSYKNLYANFLSD